MRERSKKLWEAGEKSHPLGLLGSSSGSLVVGSPGLAQPWRIELTVETVNLLDLLRSVCPGDESLSS